MDYTKCERQLTLDRGETPIQDHRVPFPDGVWFLVKMTGGLENVAHGVRVNDPQAFFLHSDNSVRTDSVAREPKRHANPKQSIPANYCSVLFQKLPLEYTYFFTMPPP